jgi:hypothetical protein
MYKQLKNIDGSIRQTQIKSISEGAWIPCESSNTDYANFKKAILADQAQLQDADGNIMTAAEAKEFVATLP